jgi:IS1 family transposase
MNRLSNEKREQIVRAMVEGNSVRSITRMTGVCQEAILKLLRELGTACAKMHDRKIRAIKAKRLQCDEIWSFVGAKMRNASPEQKAEGWGDVWTWTAIDADSKLCVSYRVGGRGADWAKDFVWDVRLRVVGRPQITTDAHKPYLTAIEEAFGANVDYAQLHKIYGSSNEPETRYSPGRIIGSDMKTVIGDPDYRHVSTSFAERQNLTMRMSMRRFTRLTNAFSKKLDNHCHAVAIYFAYYNWCRVHQTLRVTPAMEAGLTDHVWTVMELLGLLAEQKSQAAA